ncbi:hypothetical protein BV898_09682 [Hypsibius exemplaris]|uniref:Uncharacterized protein n=1 Tax=Hypsibius exemplaris TaxID=2072580 RepID=A0A1W0WLW9_HYPEX|nr:hypothetical protein BV898_09682 [Hypsibius exemplaris]
MIRALQLHSARRVTERRFQLQLSDGWPPAPAPEQRTVNVVADPTTVCCILLPIGLVHFIAGITMLSVMLASAEDPSVALAVGMLLLALSGLATLCCCCVFCSCCCGRISPAGRPPSEDHRLLTALHSSQLISMGALLFSICGTFSFASAREPVEPGVQNAGWLLLWTVFVEFPTVVVIQLILIRPYMKARQLRREKAHRAKLRTERRVERTASGVAEPRPQATMGAAVLMLQQPPCQVPGMPPVPLDVNEDDLNGARRESTISDDVSIVLAERFPPAYLTVIRESECPDENLPPRYSSLSVARPPNYPHTQRPLIGSSSRRSSMRSISSLPPTYIEALSPVDV